VPVGMLLFSNGIRALIEQGRSSVLTEWMRSGGYLDNVLSHFADSSSG
jgi:hypothetical protein